MFFAKVYENFTVTENSISVNAIIWSVCAGLALGVVLYVISRHNASLIIKALVSNECNSKENAKKAEDIGLSPDSSLSERLREHKAIRKYVYIANPEECKLEEKDSSLGRLIRKVFSRGEKGAVYDMEKALLYISEEKRHIAEIRYEQKGSPVYICVIAIVLFAAAAVGVTLAFPKILELLDSAITAFKNL